MPREIRESRRMHTQLFLGVGSKLPSSSRNYEQFLTATKSFLEERDIAENKNSAEDMLAILESRGYISIGDYRTLKEILTDAGLEEIRTIVEGKESEIKKQLELEKGVDDSKNPVKNAPNPPGVENNLDTEERPIGEKRQLKK